MPCFTIISCIVWANAVVRGTVVPVSALEVSAPDDEINTDELNGARVETKVSSASSLANEVVIDGALLCAVSDWYCFGVELAEENAEEKVSPTPTVGVELVISELNVAGNGVEGTLAAVDSLTEVVLAVSVPSSSNEQLLPVHPGKHSHPATPLQRP